MDVEIFESERNNCGFILYPDTCVRGLNERLDGLSPREPLLSGVQACGHVLEINSKDARLYQYFKYTI